MTQRAPDSPAAVVPAVGTAGSLTTVRSLGRRGIRTIAVSERDAPPSFSSRYCDETRSVPSPERDLLGYRDALLDLAARDDVETVVPMREADAHVLAKYRDTFAGHIRTPWPTFGQLTDVHDRVRLLAAADRAGISYPETARLDEVDDWDRERIVKARCAILTADTADSVPEGGCRSPPKTVFLDPGVDPDVDAFIERMGHVPIAQTYLDGTEYCFRALCRDGEPVVSSQKKLIRGYKYARGPSVYHEAVDRSDLAAAGRALLAELEWDGLASVGFIEADGAFNLLEVNPRIPASLPVDHHAGVDYPARYWALARGRPEVTATPPDYRVGTASHLLRGELVHLHSVAFEEYPLADRPGLGATTVSIAASLLTQSRFDLFSLDDPAPFVRDAANAVGKLLSRS